MSLSSQTDVTPNKKQRRGIVVPLTKSKSNLWEVMKDSNLHLTTIRTVSSSCRCASDYTNHLFDFIMNEQFSLHFGFSGLFLPTRLQRFHQCLHRRFFIPM